MDVLVHSVNVRRAAPVNPSYPALPELYRRYFAAIAAKCRRIVGSPDDAADIAQEAFLRLVREPPPGLDPEAPRATLAWLYRTSTRIAIDQLRARKIRPSSRSPEELAAMNHPTPEPLEASVARSELLQLLRATPDEELEAVILCRLDGMTHDEAGAMLDRSPRTVRRHLARFDERRRTLADVPGEPA
jgi:RNA polymerase sigma-70 factor (ECF subfamily)